MENRFVVLQPLAREPSRSTLRWMIAFTLVIVTAAEIAWLIDEEPGSTQIAASAVSGVIVFGAAVWFWLNEARTPPSYVDITPAGVMVSVPAYGKPLLIPFSEIVSVSRVPGYGALDEIREGFMTGQVSVSGPHIAIRCRSRYPPGFFGRGRVIYRVQLESQERFAEMVSRELVNFQASQASNR